MTAIIVPLLIAILPLAGVSILQFILPVLGSLLAAELGVPPESYGWIGGSIGLGTILFLLCNHAILPVLGPLRTLRFGLLLAIAGVALMLLGTWPGMIGGALLIGFGYGTTTPAGSQILVDFTPPPFWGTIFSMRQAAVPVGGVIAGVLGSWLISEGGWRAPLHVVILICAALALTLLLVPLRYNSSRPLKPFSIRQLLHPSTLVRPFTTVRAVKGLPSLVAVGWALAFVHATVTSFFVIYLSTGVGLSISRAAFLFSVVQGCAIVGRVFFGAIADRLGRPASVLKILAPLSATSAIMLAHMALDWTPIAHVLGAIAIGMTVGTWNGLYLAEIARLTPAADVGEATAGSSVFTFTSYLLAPPLVGWLIPRLGYSVTLELVAGTAVLALIILVLRDRRTPVTA